MYTVQVNDPPACYKRGHFPRKFKLLKDAKLAAKGAVDAGASFARIEFPNGVEVDFRPTKNEHSRRTTYR